jgi:hypothetical protein
MNKINSGLISLLTILFSQPLFANTANLTEWGTVANVVHSTCIGDTCTLLDVFITGITPEIAAGSNNAVSAATGLVSIPQGTAQSSGEITGGLGTPILKAQASSATDSWIGAGAFAIQGYQYTGINTQIISMAVLFDGTITNPDADTATGFGVGMYLFSPGQIDFSTLLNDPYSILGGLALFADVALLPTTQIYELEVTNSGIVNATGHLSIELNPGDQFYLAGGILAAAGGQGAIADAFSTLTVDIDPEFETLLDAASISAVPVPAAIWLFCTALFGLAGLKNFRRELHLSH